MFEVGCTPPLHGVACHYESTSGNHSLPLDIQVRQGQVVLDSRYQRIWSSVDAGANHHTQVQAFARSSEVQSERATMSHIIVQVDCEGRGLFWVDDTHIVIDWESNGTDAAHYFQSIAIALWLELKHIPCIHANALSINDNAFALIAPSGTGKSTLSAYLQQRGARWYTDDMLALYGLNSGSGRAFAGNSREHCCHIYPSWPTARLWPDAIEHVLGSKSDTHDKVHARFAKRKVQFADAAMESAHANAAFDPSKPVTMTQLYYLERVETAPGAEAFCDIQSLPSAAQLLCLLKNSMLADAYHVLGLEQSRLNQLAAVCSQMSLKRIRYSEGVAGLALVRQAITDDLNRQPYSVQAESVSIIASVE